MRKLLAILLLFALQSFKSQTMDWVSLSQELSGPVNDLVVYDGKLIACGSFKMANSVLVNNIAAWDGAQWTGLGNGLFGSSANKMAVLNNELYVVGPFTKAGDVVTTGIAKWNGTTWTSVATNAYYVYTIVSFNNEIYIGGDFGHIDGVAANRIAKYNGSNWQALGSGIADGYIYDLCVFNNALYASGSFGLAGNNPAAGLAKWDGTSWQGLNRGSCWGNKMIGWDRKLLLSSCTNTATHTGFINQWDGTNWSVFYQPIDGLLREFYVFNNRLYAAWGPNVPTAANDSWVYVWNPNSETWTKGGTGINYTVYGLCEYKGELYCAGSFNKYQNARHSYVAKLSTATGFSKNELETLEVKCSPNPVTDKLNIEVKDDNAGTLNFALTNILGQTVFKSDLNNCPANCSIDLSFLERGIYYLNIKSDKGHALFKIIKE